MYATIMALAALAVSLTLSPVAGLVILFAAAACAWLPEGDDGE